MYLSSKVYFSFSFLLLLLLLPLPLLVSPRGDPLIYDQHARCGKNSRCICSFNGTRGRIVEGYLRHFTVRGSVSENHTSCGKIMEGERGEGIARRCKCELKKVFLAVVESCAAGTCVNARGQKFLTDSFYFWNFLFAIPPYWKKLTFHILIRLFFRKGSTESTLK